MLQSSQIRAQYYTINHSTIQNWNPFFPISIWFSQLLPHTFENKFLCCQTHCTNFAPDIWWQVLACFISFYEPRDTGSREVHHYQIFICYTEAINLIPIWAPKEVNRCEWKVGVGRCRDISRNLGTTGLTYLRPWEACCSSDILEASLETVNCNIKKAMQ